MRAVVVSGSVRHFRSGIAARVRHDRSLRKLDTEATPGT